MKVRHRPYHAPRFVTEQATGADAMTLPLNGYRQTRDYTSGFAAALMITRYFDTPLPARDLFRRLAPDRDGVRAPALVRELRAAGLRARPCEAIELGQLASAIEHNKLLLARIGERGRWLVIYGYARPAQAPARVFVADPDPLAGGCERIWEEVQAGLHSHGLVCSRPGREGAAAQTPLELVDDNAPAPPPPSPGRVVCRVHGLDESPAVAEPDPTQLLLPL
ncbi:MAG: hypothetical protein Tsb0020_55450 [Haliangiales bacterium]